MRIKTEYIATNSKDVVRHIQSGKWHSKYRRTRNLMYASIFINLILFLMWVIK